MSYAAERWARSQVAGNARAKAVLIELAHCLNGRTGQCTPSVAYLSRVTELKPDTITKATNDLQDRGLITKTVIKTKSGRSCSYRLIGFVHSEWDIHENEDIPENGGIPDSAGTHTPENVVTGNPKNGVTHTPENGDRTGNKNREIEQGSRTENVVPAPASDDLFDEPVQMVEKPKKKTTDRGSRLTIDALPDDWKAFAEAEEPDLDPYRLFDNFKDYWTSVSGAKAIKKDWTATWRNFVRSFNNAPDWKRRPMLKNGVNPNRKPTDPQYGIGVCQPLPEEEVHWLTDEERAESRRQMEAEGYAPF